MNAAWHVSAYGVAPGDIWPGIHPLQSANRNVVSDWTCCLWDCDSSVGAKYVVFSRSEHIIPGIVLARVCCHTIHIGHLEEIGDEMCIPCDSMMV